MELKRQNYSTGESFEVPKNFIKAYGRNWSRVCGCNALLLGTNILSVLISLCIVLFIIPLIFPFFMPTKLADFLAEHNMISDANSVAEAADSVFFMISLVLELMMTGMLLVVNGPIQAGVCYYFRNLLTGDASFKTDFVKGMKMNWKKSLGASILSILMTVILCFNIGYYQNGFLGSASVFFKGFFTCVLVFWINMQIYVYPLISCTKLSLKNVYKNAALLAITKFPFSFCFFLLEVVLFLVLPGVLIFTLEQVGYSIAMIFYLLFSFGFTTFLATYKSWKLIEEYIEEED